MCIHDTGVLSDGTLVPLNACLYTCILHVYVLYQHSPEELAALTSVSADKPLVLAGLQSSTSALSRVRTSIASLDYGPGSDGLR